METTKKATAMAESLKANGDLFVVIPIASLISIIVSMIQAIMNCFQPDPAPTPAKSVQDYVNAHYKDGQYTPRLVRRMKVQAYAAARKHKVKINDQQAEALAIKSLDEARLGDSDTQESINHFAQFAADVPE